MLDREFGSEFDVHERALSRLAGGIANRGHQCGMLWGATMAVGAEAGRRCDDSDEAVGLALAAARGVLTSFRDRTQTVDCREITGRRLDTIRGMAGLMLDTFRKGMDKSQCFVLAEDWTPEALDAAHDGLSALPEHERPPRSCASVVVEKMGGTKDEAVMVAGFGGGLGLTGGGCGALAAAMWMKGLQWCRAHPGKTPGPWTDTGDKNTLVAFTRATGGEFSCRAICGRTFDSVDDHAEFVDDGGCGPLIDALVQS